MNGIKEHDPAEVEAASQPAASVRVPGRAAEAENFQDEPEFMGCRGQRIGRGRSYEIEGQPADLIRLADHFWDVCSEDWDRSASEKQACRVAARRIYQELGVEMPYQMRPRKRRRRR